ncbi:MAG: PH domain-containing protein [Phycisphaerales bacterium]
MSQVAETVDAPLIAVQSALPDRKLFLDAIEKPAIRRRIEQIGPLPYDLPSLFPKRSGWGADRQVKNKVKLLQAVEPVLGEMLFHDEQVLFVTKGIFSSFVEQYFLGWIAYAINRTTFIFTNLRIIQFNTDRKGRPGSMHWQIPYDQIRKYKAGGFMSGSLKFWLVNKSKYVFVSMPKYDAKPLRELIDLERASVSSEATGLPHHGGCDPLCPACHAPQARKQYQCDNCGERFIHPMKPAMLSLVLPCLGDFYMGHKGIAILEFLGYLLMWFIVLGGIFAGLEKGNLSEHLPFLILLPIIVHGFDAFITHRVASKGLKLASRAWKHG